MARPRVAKPVKLFCGMLSGDEDLLRRARHLLTREFGETDLDSAVWPFEQTDYYEPDMGPALKRWFVSFERLIRPDTIGEIKRRTNDLEQRISDECLSVERPRPVNLDPGYLDLNKLTLATTKDASHRVYVGLGIYVEVTLCYRGGGWQPWPWTYPDYHQAEYHEYFDRMRARYRDQRRDFDRLMEQPPMEGS